MSTTECITQTSLSPTKAANGAARTRSATRAASARRRAAPASRSRPAARPRRRPGRARRARARRRTGAPRARARRRSISDTAAPREPAARHAVQRMAAGARPPRSRRCRPRRRRLAQDAASRSPPSSTPQRLQALAHVRDLVALGVEGPDQGDGGHQTAGRGFRQAPRAGGSIDLLACSGRSRPPARRPCAWSRRNFSIAAAAAGLGRVADLGAVGDRRCGPREATNSTVMWPS